MFLSTFFFTYSISTVQSVSQFSRADFHLLRKPKALLTSNNTEPFATNKIQHKLIMQPIKTKVRAKYIIITAFAVLSSWLLHEFAHYLTGEALGYKMAMSLNQGYPVDGHYNRDLHYQLISAAGPLVTLIEALLVSLLMQRRRTVLPYPFLFICFYMRLLAAGMSFINPNDEARISKTAGIGAATLSIFVVALLFCLIYKTSKQYGFSKKFNWVNLGLVILFSSIIILNDQAFTVRIF